MQKYLGFPTSGKRILLRVETASVKVNCIRLSVLLVWNAWRHRQWTSLSTCSFPGAAINMFSKTRHTLSTCTSSFFKNTQAQKGHLMLPMLVVSSLHISIHPKIKRVSELSGQIDRLNEKLEQRTCGKISCDRLLISKFVTIACIHAFGVPQRHIWRLTKEF